MMFQISPFIRLKFNFKDKQRYIYNLLTNENILGTEDMLNTIKKFQIPAKKTDIVRQIGEENFEKMIFQNMFISQTDIWQITNIENLEIETCTHCNWRCDYCPVKIRPKPIQTMEMCLFEEIIDKACRHPSIKYVTFNSFNEPTLDSLFEERIISLSKTHLKLILHTNGSMLDSKKIALLKKTNIVKIVHFNLPSLDPEIFKQVTGSSTYSKTISNIEIAIESGLNVNFSVNKIQNDFLGNFNLIKQRYQGRTTNEIKMWETVDRAGLLLNEYGQKVNISGFLYGCRRVLNWLNISVNGDCFICHHDYDQRYTFANIRQGEIDAVLNCQEAKLFRKYVFGEKNACERFICRRCSEMKGYQQLSLFQSHHSK